MTAFTLSELSAALHVSVATMSTILLALIDAGFVVRHPVHKTYTLGPSLVAIGYAASSRHPIVEYARPEMAELARLGTECVASAIVGGDLVHLAIDGQASARTRALRVGQRIPLVPPYGHVYLAWSDQGTVARWVARLGEGQARIRGAELEESLDAVRQRGFAVALDNDGVATVQRLVDEIARQPWDENLRNRLAQSIPRQVGDYALSVIEPESKYDINNIAAPVFGPNGTVAYALHVHGVGSRSGAEILEVGERLNDVCLTLTRRMGGRTPERR